VEELFAEAMGLKARGTLYIIIEALRKGLLDKNNARETVLMLVGKGFRIEPKLKGNREIKVVRTYALTENV
jgi:predicted nucleic acid-binding protein